MSALASREQETVSVRKLMCTVAIAALGALFWGGATAGAQTTQAFTCNYTLSSTALGQGGGPVQISGTAPGSTTVHIFVNGTEVLPAVESSPTGTWGPVTLNITATSTIAVNLGASYVTTPCVGPASVSVEAATAALPRTGSNDTKPFVLVGITILVVGLALVFAARRREHTHGRV